MTDPLADLSDGGLANLWAIAQQLDQNPDGTVTDWANLGGLDDIGPVFDPHDDVWAGVQRQILADLEPSRPLPWRATARPSQLPPPGRWRHWLIMAGRGWGKTFVGAGWLAERALSDPGDYAIVAPTLGDAKLICVEGPSGLLKALGGEDGPHVEQYNRSEYTLYLTNGSRIRLGSADAPARIRGWNFKGVWCVAEGEPVETRRGRIPIEQVRVGDEVMTREGWRKVTAATRTKRDVPTVRISTDTGSLRCTADHPVWVEGKGWTLAGEVQPGDTLLSWSDEKSWKDSPNRDRQPGSSGADSAGTATPRTATTASATASCSTTPSGPPSTDPFPTATRSTTATTTGPTTATTTSNCSPEASTPATTAKFVLTSGGTTSPPRSPQSALATPGPGDNPATSSALSVAAPSSPPASAPASAEVTAARLSTVRGVEPDSNSDVYDLTVEDAHEFYAGDGSLLVHNCDEVGSWRDLTVWNEGIKFATRIGDPRIVITTTPTRGNKILVRMLDAHRDAGGSISGGLAANTFLTRGGTRENAKNLSADWLAEIEEEFAGTTLGRQELDGELLRAVPGALITLDIIEATRLTAERAPDPWRMVCAVDPAVTNNEDSDECGIIMAGLGPAPVDWQPPPGVPPSLANAPHLYLYEDYSRRATPQAWATRALEAADDWAADVITAETNNGGDLVHTMVQLVAEQSRLRVPHLTKVSASVGKRARAEPMGGMWEQHRVHVVGTLKHLEDQWASWVPGSGADSPDRLDASVWAGVELLPHLGVKPGGQVRLIA